ncbi:MAG: thioredoxin-disulfide reductase [Candidatus Anstonellales archaeon]
MEEREVVIIGSGIAGATAAIYTTRALLDTLIVSSGPFGGQMLETEKICNWPGEREISGFELAQKLKEHVLGLGAEVREFTNVESVDLRNKIVTTMGGGIKAKAIIIATGEKPKALGAKGETEFRGRGVSYCSTCDGPFYTGKKILVVGGGNSAFQESLYLSRFASEITLVHRRDEFRAEQALVKEAKENPKIKFMTSAAIEEIKGSGRVESVVLRDLKEGTSKEIQTNGVFIFIGSTPRSEIFEVEKDEKGYIIIDEHMRTSVEGVFAAGDVANTPIKQLVVAAGTGAIAGVSAYEYLKG